MGNLVKKISVRKHLLALAGVWLIASPLYAYDPHFFRIQLSLAFLPVVVFLFAAYLSHRRFVAWSGWSSRAKKLALLLMIVFELYWFLRILG